MTDSLVPASRLAALALRIGALQGWRRWLLGLGLGVLSAASMPPFCLVPVLLVALPGLVWLIDGARSKRQAAFDGWRFGFGLFTPSLYWMTLSLFVDIGQFWFLVPFSLMGLPALLGVFTGAGTALARLAPQPGFRRILLLAVTWTAFEWLRGHILTGFPWILIGQTWSGSSGVLVAMLQSTALFGTYGLSLVTVLIAALPACLGYPGPGGRRIAPPALGFLLLAVLIAWGGLRLDHGPDPSVPKVRLRVLQTAIPQSASWSQAEAVRELDQTIDLASGPGFDTVTDEIWPESSIEFMINRDTDLRAALTRAVPPNGLLLAGTLRGNDTGPITQIWNSVGVIDHAGRLIAAYDKFHLVPFGEYVPFRSILRFNTIVADRFDFSTGPGPRTFALPGLPPVGPIICYEAIFPHAVADETHRPDWLVNVTNDAWFGISTGPYQHLAIARIRAVEEGLPLVRSANGGISAIVDAHGRILRRLPLGASGTIDGALPEALPATPYARFGDALLVLLVIPLLGVAFWPERRRRALVDATEGMT
jgi:apolipoprotein N-acyltransferase